MLKKLVWLIILIPVITWAGDFIEGKDYQLTPNNPSIETSKTPTVTEFFSYGCPSCFHVDPALTEWTNKVGTGVTITRIPVVFKPDWELYAKAYYTAKTLALTNKVNPLLFKAIQEEHKSLNTPQAMINFFVAQGVDREIAKSAFENSPTIEMNVKNGMTLMAQYQINAVPAFIINNKYKTDLQMAGSPERLFQIIDYLVRKTG
jgi:thiol:disulfide interchange protein DsbA